MGQLQDRRRFIAALAASPLALSAAKTVMAAGLVNSGPLRSKMQSDRVLNAVADTLLPRLGDGRLGDWTAADLDLPSKFYRDPYFGMSRFLGFLIHDLQGRAFLKHTQAFEDLTYSQRLAIFEEGRNHAFGPIRRLFNGVAALTYYAVFAQTEQGRASIGFSLDPSEYWRDFRYPGVSFPPSGLTDGGNLP